MILGEHFGARRMGTEAKFPHTEKHADGQWVLSKSESIGGVNSYEHLEKTPL